MGQNDDLTPLLLPGNTGEMPELGFHQGIVMAWSVETGENIIRVAGSNFNDLQMLNITEALVLQPGHVVGLLRFKNTYFILGRIVTPDTDEFFTGVMPNLAYTLWPVNSDAAIQTSSADSNYYPKFVGAFVVSHRKLYFRAGLNINTVTVQANWRLQWYTSHPGNIANPPNGTLIHQAAVVSAGVSEQGIYTWPVAQRGTLVYLSFEARMVAGISGTDWAAVMPRYLYGAD